MIIDAIDVEKTISDISNALAEEPSISPALKKSLELLIVLVYALLARIGLNSRNSSKPPVSDPYRKKEQNTSSERKPGGQLGHVGTTLKPVADPDVIIPIEIDQSLLPPGNYTVAGWENRQVIDWDIHRVVTEYRAQIVKDERGRYYTAHFPKNVTRPIQYGTGVKVHAIYMSQYQMLPYNRIVEDFADQIQIPISAGSLVSFNEEAYKRLDFFEAWIKEKITQAPLIHVDETGINIGGSRCWLHNSSTTKYSYFYPHIKRGGVAISEIGILPNYQGIICHDHWKVYFNYGSAHALCNAHHLRELTRAWEQDQQQWAQQMHELLKEILQEVSKSGGCLDALASQGYRKRFSDILEIAEKECPALQRNPEEKKRGKIAKSKSRNLLERLKSFENETLRFMDDPIVPFTNNQAENDLRMIKVQQKVSGCFRSMEGAKIFCRIRSYLTTCRKHGVSATEALYLLFQDEWPKFMEVSHSPPGAE